MNWQPYPEDIRETPLGGLWVEVHQPNRFQVVMGASGKPQVEVHSNRLQAKNIPLFKRKGGGGTVVLGPGVMVLTIHAGVKHRYCNLGYFQAINRSLIEVFQTWRALPFKLQGISDIALNGKKLVGTSIFRRKQYLLYQASILVTMKMEMIEQLLCHPPREPNYRQGRSHRDFLTDLRQIGIQKPIDNLMLDLKSLLPQILPEHIHQVNPQPPGK